MAKWKCSWCGARAWGAETENCENCGVSHQSDDDAEETDLLCVGGDISLEQLDAGFIDWDAVAHGSDGAHLHYRGEVLDLEEMR